jgi:hypothetical protein
MFATLTFAKFFLTQPQPERYTLSASAAFLLLECAFFFHRFSFLQVLSSKETPSKTGPRHRPR